MSLLSHQQPWLETSPPRHQKSFGSQSLALRILEVSVYYNTSLKYLYLLHVNIFVPQKLLRRDGFMKMLDLADPLEEVVKKLFTDFDVLRVLIALFKQ